jgi:hypothetical protein
MLENSRIVQNQHYFFTNISMLRSRLSALMYIHETFTNLVLQHFDSLFVWLVADGWCWFVLRVKYCWLIAGGWFVLREKYYWLVADKPSEQGARVNGFCPKAKKTHQIFIRDRSQHYRKLRVYWSCFCHKYFAVWHV